MEKWTYETIVAKFKQDLKDEIEDSCAYMDMAKSLQHQECPNHALLMKGLLYASYDEYTHARFIRHVLLDAGETVPSTEESALKEQKTRLEHIFLRGLGHAYID